MFPISVWKENKTVDNCEILVYNGFMTGRDALSYL